MRKTTTTTVLFHTARFASGHDRKELLVTAKNAQYQHHLQQQHPRQQQRQLLLLLLNLRQPGNGINTTISWDAQRYDASMYFIVHLLVICIFFKKNCTVLSSSFVVPSVRTKRRKRPRRKERGITAFARSAIWSTFVAMVIRLRYETLQNERVRDIACCARADLKNVANLHLIRARLRRLNLGFR